MRREKELTRSLEMGRGRAHPGVCSKLSSGTGAQFLIPCWTAVLQFTKSYGLRVGMGYFGGDFKMPKLDVGKDDAQL